MGFSLMNKNLTVYFTLKEALYKSTGLVTIEIARVGSQEFLCQSLATSSVAEEPTQPARP